MFFTKLYLFLTFPKITATQNKFLVNSCVRVYGQWNQTAVCQCQYETIQSLQHQNLYVKSTEIWECSVFGLDAFFAAKSGFFSNISHISSFKCICHCKTSGGELCKSTGIWHVQIWMFREPTFFTTKNCSTCPKIGERRCLILNKAKCGHPMLHLGAQPIFTIFGPDRLARARILDGFLENSNQFYSNVVMPQASRQETG